MVITIWLKEWKPGLNWESSGSQHTHCEIHIFQFRSLLKKDNLGCNWRTNAVAPNWGKPITLLGLPGSHHLQSYTSYSFTAASHSLFLPLMVEEAVGCQMSLGECQSVTSSPSLVPPLVFPAMPRLFARHSPPLWETNLWRQQARKWVRACPDQTESGQSRELFLITFDNSLFKSDQTRGRDHLQRV